MLTIGLTGSIGMGKSATADMFRKAGIPVHDSDAVVHELYRGRAVAEIGLVFPDAIVDGKVDRTRLAPLVIGRPEQMRMLESIIHPLVEESRIEFLSQQRRADRSIIVVDIPLLFEIGGEKMVDLVVVCSAPDHVQKQRVLARPGMTKERFEAIKSKQVANSDKRRRAHFVIDTSLGFKHAEDQISALLRSLASCS